MTLSSIPAWTMGEALMRGMVLRNSVPFLLSFRELAGRTMCEETHSLGHGT